MPASNFPGKPVKVVPSNETFSTILPPPCQGGMASKSAVLPYNTPIPAGAYSLWPENT
ncbi:Uncharacterised protein [Vibrio cholerae]|nr:Uncharacterised protein [Vibrio cholerae]